MLDKILAPLDGSVLADAVLPHITALTRINGTKVTLLHVLEAHNGSSTEVDPVDWHLRKTEAQSYLNEVAKRLQRFNLATEQVVLEGRAPDRIVEYAQKENFDLVALTSHGRGGLSGWNLSSVAHKVIHRIRKSTMIIPAHRTVRHRTPEGEWDAVQYRRILVPLDGSSRAEVVLPLAEALARYHGSELSLVHVVTPPDMIQRMPLNEEDLNLQNRITERNRAEVKHYFTQLKGRLSANVTTSVLESDNVERALVHAAEDQAVDLVLLAAHGQSGHNGRPYGRLATSFFNYGSVPLYIHQDLSPDEIEPLYAERMLENQEPRIDQRMNVYDYVVN